MKKLDEINLILLIHGEILVLLLAKILNYFQIPL